MIINNSRRFLFIHVPKAAGTTVSEELSRLTTFRDLEIGGTRHGEKLQDLFAARFDLRKHSTGAAIREKAGPEVWDGFFVFAFVRNPYARAYSLHRFLADWRDGPHHAEAAAMSFDEFLISPLVAEGRAEIAKPQAHWLVDAAGDMLPGLDFVGRLERFEEDFSFILSVIERRPTRFHADRRANALTHDDEWRAALTPAAKAAIETAYAADFQLLGYPFELAAEAA